MPELVHGDGESFEEQHPGLIPGMWGDGSPPGAHAKWVARVKAARMSTEHKPDVGPVSSHPALLKMTDGRHYKPQENLQGTFESKPSSENTKFYIMMCILNAVSICYYMNLMCMVATSTFEHEVEMDVLGFGEEKKKPFAERLREKIASLVRVRKGLTVDSGAADHVMPAGWLWFLRVRPSAGSKSGLHYVAANNARLPNQGQSRLKFMSAEGTVASILFQIAAINKPLVSVSKLIDEGYEVIFTLAESYILHRETGKRILLKRERGVFIIDAYASPTEDFSRQR